MNGYQFMSDVLGGLGLMWFLGTLFSGDPAWPRRLFVDLEESVDGDDDERR